MKTFFKKDSEKKREKKRIEKKPSKAGMITAILLLAVASVLLFLEVWVFSTWRGLRMDEIIYQLNAPLQGTGDGMVTKGVTHSLIPAGIIMIVFFIIFFHYKETKRFYALIRGTRIVGVLMLIVSLAMGVIKLDLGNYLIHQLSDSTFIEDNYVNPSTTQLTFPEKKRNLIYIYLESMEMTYADQNSGGAFSYNNIPELTALSQENENFSGGSKQLNGGRVLPGSTYTMAGLFTQTTGLPLKVDLSEAFTDKRGSFNKMNTQSHFFSKVTSLGDVLKKNGYKNVFMLGSDATFGGRKLYFEEHGKYELDDYNWMIEQGVITSDYYVFWGMEDQKLFASAKERLTQLSSSDEPFNFTMLTVDTHFEDGYTCELCGSEYGGNSYANVMACSSRQVSEFIEWVKKQDFYENTTIVISGDHLTMDSDFCQNVSSDYERKVYTAYINSAVEPADASRERKYSTLDAFPTTLAAMGVKIQGNKLGLGTNLFSTEDTLIEQYGYEELAENLEKKSSFMEELANLNLYDSQLMEMQGMTPTAKLSMEGVDETAGTISFRVKEIENVYEKVKSVELELLSNDNPADVQTVTMKKEKKGVYTASVLYEGQNLKDAQAVVYAVGKSGKRYEVSRMTGDLTLKVTDIVTYLDLLRENPQYTIFATIRDDGTHSLNIDITSRLRSLGLEKSLPGHYRWSYYAIITPDGVIDEQLSEKELSTSGTLADGAKYSVISQGGLSGAGGGAGRYLTCSVKINGVECAVQKIGLNFVVYDTENSKVVDSVEFNTYQGLGARRVDPSSLTK